MTTCKIFVGNLPFQTTGQQLADHFKGCGNVKSGVIITRGRRSLGYGFIEFETTSEATKAVESVNQTIFGNRTIKVEFVRDPPPARQPTRSNAAAAEGSAHALLAPGDYSNAQPQLVGNEQGVGDAGAAVRRNYQQQQQQQQQGRRFNLRRRAPRRMGQQRGAPQGGVGGSTTGQVQQQQQQQMSQNQGGGAPNEELFGPPPRRRRPIPRYRRPNAPQMDPSGLPPRLPPPPREKILSKTAVFVANIPYSVRDDGLREVFQGYQVKTAHVVTTRTGHSRGYGFVDFETEQDQQRAVKEKDNYPVKGVMGAVGAVAGGPESETSRFIRVTVSHSTAKPQQQQTQAQQQPLLEQQQPLLEQQQPLLEQQQQQQQQPLLEQQQQPLLEQQPTQTSETHAQATTAQVQT